MHLNEGNSNTAHVAVQSSHKPLFCLHSDPATSISHCMTHTHFQEPSFFCTAAVWRKGSCPNAFHLPWFPPPVWYIQAPPSVLWWESKLLKLLPALAIKSQQTPPEDLQSKNHVQELLRANNLTSLFSGKPTKLTQAQFLPPNSNHPAASARYSALCYLTDLKHHTALPNFKFSHKWPQPLGQYMLPQLCTDKTNGHLPSWGTLALDTMKENLLDKELYIKRYIITYVQ